MSNQLLQLEGISDEKAALLIDHFSNFYTIAADWKAKAEAIKVSGTDQVAEMKMARTGRLFLKDKRVAIENLRKQLKEESLREGQAIDRVARELKGLIEPIETYLESQEKYAEIQENIRRSNLRDTRLPALVELGYNTSAGDPADLTEGEYTQLIDSLKAIKAAKMEAERVEQERLERERRELEATRERERKELAELRAKQAEAERIDREFRAEQERIRQQNERERKELEKKLAEAKEENDRLEADKKDFISKKTEAENLGLITGDLLAAENVLDKFFGDTGLNFPDELEISSKDWVLKHAPELYNLEGVTISGMVGGRSFPLHQDELAAALLRKAINSVIIEIEL